MLDNSQIKRNFNEQFSGEPELIVRAPGRVNLIGEHTDYNLGFVLPMAIDRSIWIALRKRHDREVHCFALAYGELLTLSLDHLEKGPHHWGQYLKGVAWKLLEEGFRLKGWEGVLCGDIPIGAGLGSSAAIGMAFLRVFSEISHFPWDSIPMAKLCQQSEIEWVGLDSGIMDQMISAIGQPGSACLIDCRSLESETIPIPEEVAIMVLDSGVRRDLVDSAYNLRQAQCNEAARICGVPSLRDLSSDSLLGHAPKMDPTLYRRARHVLSENDRTLEAAQSLRTGDMLHLGELMNASHRSLREDYEVSSDELDALVEIAQLEKALGARMTGAGFGGCVVSLIQGDQVEDFSQRVMQRYRSRTGLALQTYPCNASSGVRVVFDSVLRK